MLDRSYHDGVTVIRLAREPANVMDTDLSLALAGALEECDARADTCAIVLTGSGTVFSAGVDLFRVLDGGREYLETFIPALGRLFEAAGSVGVPLVAAVNGHAIAGGCVLACACDFRILTSEGATIGLPELRVGVPFPSAALAAVCARVPRRFQREAILLGRIYDPAGALERGLVDELADPDRVLPRAIEVARELGSVPRPVFDVTKRQLASAGWGELGAGGGADPFAAEVAALWGASETGMRVRGYLEHTLGKKPAS